MLEVVGEAECFDVLLHTRGDISLVMPETVARELTAQGSEEGLDVSQLALGTRGSTETEYTVVGFYSILGDGAMEEKDELFREIGNVAARLAAWASEVGVTRAGKARVHTDLYETFSSVVVVVELLPELLEGVNDGGPGGK